MNRIHTYVQTHMYILICIYSSIDIRWKRYVYTFIVYADPYTHTYTYVGIVAIILKRRQWIWTGVKKEERKNLEWCLHTTQICLQEKKWNKELFGCVWFMFVCIFLCMCTYLYMNVFIQRCAYVSIHRCIHRCLLMLMDDTYQHQLSFQTVLNLLR